MKKPTNLIQFVEDRLGHDYRYAVDFSKASKKSYYGGLESVLQ